MLFRNILLVMLMLLSALCLEAQEFRNLSESQQMMRMDEGVEYMNTGKFALADDIFREVLKNVEVVPADLCFYFGKNSYHLDKYKQSVDWLNKYIELKGTSGRFFDQAVEYIQLAEADMQESVRNTPPPARAEGSKTEKSRANLDCTQVPFVVCPLCRGEGVIIQNGVLGSSVYKPCTHCNETGRMNCEDYKLYLKGKFIP